MPGTASADSTTASPTVVQGAVLPASRGRPAAQELPSFPIISAAVKAAISDNEGLFYDARDSISNGAGGSC